MIELLGLNKKGVVVMSLKADSLTDEGKEKIAWFERACEKHNLFCVNYVELLKIAVKIMETN